MNATELKQLQARRTRLGNEQAVLESKIATLRTSLRAVMAQAKDQFGTAEPARLQLLLQQKEQEREVLLNKADEVLTLMENSVG